MTHDPVNHPKHYTSHPSGIECIDITKHMNFCLGNVFKYCWRADLKADAIEDLRKARFYLDAEIARREKAQQEVERARELSGEFFDGDWAFREGRSLDDNPFGRLEPGYLSWQRGWQAARWEKEPAAAQIFRDAELARREAEQ